MNRFVISCIMALSFLSLSAQDATQYQVFLLKGDVFKVVRRERQPVRKYDVLNKKDVLSMSPGSELKLVQMRDSVVVTLKGHCAGSIMSLIAEQSGAEQSMTARYYAFVSKSLSGHGVGHHSVSTVSYREGEDSLLLPIAGGQRPLALDVSCRQYAAPVGASSSLKPLYLKPMWLIHVPQKTKKKHGRK